MLRKFLKSLINSGGSPFQTYYQRVLETSPETAPSAEEARADYLRSVKRFQV